MTKAERFATLVSAIAREVMRRRASDACCGDLTLEQFETLRILDGGTQTTIGALSTALRVDLSTMSRNVSVLEKSGYVSRARSAGDGRVVHVRLMAKGRRALTTLRCGERDVLGDVYERLPIREREAVVTALESLRCCLEEEEDEAACCAPPTFQKRAS
jgi:DNA-binding MarR family transcriptional regulator